VPAIPTPPVVTTWAYSDVFDVRASNIAPLVSLADLKDYLNIPQANTAQDFELRNFIAAATHIIEHEVGACAQRTVVDTFTGSWAQPYISLLTRPVLSITSVTELGVTLSGSDYQLLLPSNQLVRSIGGSGSMVFPRGWWYGINDIVVTYVAGRRIIPSNLLEAVMEWARIKFRAQRGGDAPLFDTDNPGQGGPQIGGVYIPPSVYDLIVPNLDIAAGIA
jgi:hypothetical protein